MNGVPLQIDGKYAALRRVASRDDIRSNIHAGGTAEPVEIGKTELKVAELIRPKLIADGMFLVGLVTFLILVMDGLGHAGYQPPIFWSVFITTFVFWIGIGHAGTLISAILFLFRSPWRTAVYRSTEAMTVFADEWDNLRLAFEWFASSGLSDGALRLVVASQWFAVFSWRNELREWGERAIALDGASDHPLWAGAAGATAGSHRLPRR